MKYFNFWLLGLIACFLNRPNNSFGQSPEFEQPIEIRYLNFSNINLDNSMSRLDGCHFGFEYKRALDALLIQADHSNITRPLQSVNASLLGDASLISAKYEKLFVCGNLLIISTGIGLGYNQEPQKCIDGNCSPPDDRFITIPHHITGNLGTKHHFVEFGLGGTIILGNTDRKYILYPTVGYRFLPLKSNKLNFRLYLQLPFDGRKVNDDILFVPFGLSLGYSF